MSFYVIPLGMGIQIWLRDGMIGHILVEVRQSNNMMKHDFSDLGDSPSPILAHRNEIFYEVPLRESFFSLWCSYRLLEKRSKNSFLVVLCSKFWKVFDILHICTLRAPCASEPWHLAL